MILKIGNTTSNKSFTTLVVEKSGIPLPYLQVYLDMLWREDFNRTYSDTESTPFPSFPKLKFTTKEIDDFGAIENVLQRFLSQQEVSLQEELAEKT